jgi:hypothetical protein
MSRQLPDRLLDGAFSPLPNPKLLSRWLAQGRYALTLDGLEKRCTRCESFWPADTEFFYIDNSSGDKLFCWCVACVQENHHVRRQRAATAPTEAAAA